MRIEVICRVGSLPHRYSLRGQPWRRGYIRRQSDRWRGHTAPRRRLGIRGPESCDPSFLMNCEGTPPIFSIWNDRERGGGTNGDPQPPPGRPLGSYRGVTRMYADQSANVDPNRDVHRALSKKAGGPFLHPDPPPPNPSYTHPVSPPTPPPPILNGSEV